MAKLDLKVPNMTLPDGNEIPMLGYGTGTAWYKSGPGPKNKACIEALETAMKAGYRHLDGAEVYNTEEEIGEAIKNSKIPRKDLFVTTKVIVAIDDIPKALDTSLKKLGLDYVDLYLIHAPFFAQGDESKLQAKWAEMEQVAAQGKATSIGVSNFLKPHLDAILKTCKVRPQMNQIEFHPYLQHEDLITYHKNKDIRVAAYAPLHPITKASGGPLDPLLESLAKKYAVNPGEILLRWCVELNVLPVTTSSKEQRMSDMLRIFTFSLTPKEVEDISATGNQHHSRGFWNDKFDPSDRS